MKLGIELCMGPTVLTQITADEKLHERASHFLKPHPSIITTLPVFSYSFYGEHEVSRPRESMATTDSVVFSIRGLLHTVFRLQLLQYKRSHHGKLSAELSTYVNLTL